MIAQFKDIATKAPRTLLADSVGLAAICLMLVAGLSLPGLG